MKTHFKCIQNVRWFGIMAAMILLAIPVRANPISMPEKNVTPEISFAIAFAILLEVICVWLILRRARKPRFFIVWLIGMHLLTYPAFVGLLWLLQDMRPASAVASGEGLVVLVEGILIYLICRFMVSSRSDLAAPSLAKCWLASLVGNACSVVAFPILLAIYDHFRLY